MDTQPTTKPTTTKPRRVSKRLMALGVAFLATAAIFAATTNPAGATTNRWYSVPAANGGRASASMNWFNKSYASGSAGGRIWLANDAGSANLYVQVKPNEGGTWRRATQNLRSGAAYYNWSDSFTLNYSGFMFRICKDRTAWFDSCGSAVNIYG